MFMKCIALFGNVWVKIMESHLLVDTQLHDSTKDTITARGWPAHAKLL